MRLSQLPSKQWATVDSVEPSGIDDTIARRLVALGFVRGEPVRITAHGPIDADPLLVQIGNSRFALRRLEADRVHVSIAP